MHPSAGPHHQGRRHGEHHYPYHHQVPQIPPQTHSPVQYNPYAQYPVPPQHYGAPHMAPYAHQQLPPQWQNPYMHPHPQQAPYPQPIPPQYVMPPRPFHPQAGGSPVVVSSHPYVAPATPVNRTLDPTPPVVYSQTPPVPITPVPTASAPPLPTPQPVPSTPAETPRALNTPTTGMATPTPPPISPPRQTEPAKSERKGTFYPPLPWCSFDGPFPPRASRKKGKGRSTSLRQYNVYPSLEQVGKEQNTVSADQSAEKTEKDTPLEVNVNEEAAQTPVTPATEVIEQTTTQSPQLSTPTRPAASAPAIAPPSSKPAPSSHTRTATIPAVPMIPLKSARAASVVSTTQKSTKSTSEKTEAKKPDTQSSTGEAETTVEETPKASPPAKSAPKSWAELLRAKAAPAAPHSPISADGIVTTNGHSAPKSNSLADVLATFSVHAEKKVAFLQPRGLVNSGNLCYMNSILQVLLFCVPFYDFLDQVAKRAAHSFKSETPLIDAMIMFMRDFKVIDSAESPEKLRLRLKDAELEQYGDPLAPEYVYDVIRRLPRFENMKRGQQEDAEEFLGFLLAGLHDECAHVIKSGRRDSITADGVTSPKSERSGSMDNGWLEVGPKQKASITQSSGAIEVESPITKIFGGKLRSEYKRPGEKPSVTLEPYQPLQLDIGSPEVHNISDALRGLTHLETLDGATRGAKASTKQVFIDTLPPVLILHLKRFHYDANGPHKIWKKIGYPLELEIPREVFPPHMRGSFAARGGMPRYKLAAVVYHHGKNASGGHYTVDLRRQDGREWIRMDDTVIRRIRSEDVAEGGAEEDPKILAAALEQHKNDKGSGRNTNMYVLDDQDDMKDEGGWSKVNGSDKKDPSKKWSGVVNGSTTPSSTGKRTPLSKENVKDNKVAYILFYQKIEV
ncbi:cysteine proteinase [Westerdykella ornata]|uniref:Ubiquitin carboxyl-terminal hydrolase n=1 Tax=Westerdykella ornata TaxID=318751 RepID=A0A6A6JDW3_WESOR|nr:cysteine proteinase [Westerdykella ornata]KAF2274477.1 cysteine proteinase [Westerdykella ornata]